MEEKKFEEIMSKYIDNMIITEVEHSFAKFLERMKERYKHSHSTIKAITEEINKILEEVANAYKRV